MQNDNMDETIKIVMVPLFSDIEKDITNNIKEGNDSQTYYIESQAIDTLDEGLYKLSMYKGSGDKSSIKIFKIIQLDETPPHFVQTEFYAGEKPRGGGHNIMASDNIDFKLHDGTNYFSIQKSPHIHEGFFV